MPEDFEGKELVPLSLAGSPGEARKIESVLDRAGVDYTFEITPFIKDMGLGIFGTKPLEGILFMIESSQLEFCRDLLSKAGLSTLLVD